MKPPPAKRRRVDIPTSEASRPVPKKKQVVVAPIPPPPDIDEQLFYQRAESQSKLKSAWELIFAKYECDTSAYADEIDLETGEIVVDKGHLRGLEAKSDVGEDLWANWIERGDESNEVEETGAEGSKKKGKQANGKKASKPKVPKMLVVAGTVFGITDCELCAEQDELDFTVCTHGSSSSQLDEKENTPLTPNLGPQTPASSVTKQPLHPASRIGPPVIDLDEEDDLSLATPVVQSRPSGLTPAFNILNIQPTTFPAPQASTGLPAKQSQLIPSSPIVRHVNRIRPQQKQEPPSSPPPLASSPPPALPSSSPLSMARDPWAPLADDPLADKTWHSHHPDGSPPRPRKGRPLLPTSAKPAPPSFQVNNASIHKRDSLPEPLQKAVLKATDKKKLQNTDDLLIKGTGPQNVVEEEVYSEDEESDLPITLVKIPVNPPVDTPPPKKKSTAVKSTKETPTVTSSNKYAAGPAATTPASKPKSAAPTKSMSNPDLKTPANGQPRALTKTSIKTTMAPEVLAKFLANATEKNPAKVPVKTPIRAPVKTPVKAPTPKTPPKTSSKSLPKTPTITSTSTSTSTLWSSQFTNNKKRKREDDHLSDSEDDSDVHELSDNERKLGFLNYIKSRASNTGKEAMKMMKIKPDLVKIEKGKKLDKKDMLAFYDTTDQDDDDGPEEEDIKVVPKQSLLNGTINGEKLASGAGASSSKAKATKVVVKLEDEEDGGFIESTKKKAVSVPKVSHTKPTVSGSVPTITPATVNLADSRSLLLSVMGKVNRAGGLCGAKGVNCGKPFCWDCIEAEDDNT